MKTITKCLGILTSAAVSLTVMDRLLEQQEKKNFQPYGSPLKTEFGNMTIVKAGTQGPQIVLLNGYGSASPYLEFKPLMLSLSSFAQVTLIEPLGYGCSDNPTRPRTVDNIIEELHAALKALQLKHVWLMPHSIAGIYSLAYVNKYPEDIEGILAIDPSHPEQIDHFDTTSMVKRMFMMKKMGWQRLSKKEHHTSAYGYSIEDLEQMDMMKRWHTHDQAQKNEAELFRQNMNACKDMNYPENLPVCMMLSKDNVTHFENWWLTLHQQQLSHTNYGKLVILKGNHFLHFTQSSQIALLTEETIKEYKKDGFQ